MVTFAKTGKGLLYVCNKYFKINIQEFKYFLGNTIKRWWGIDFAVIRFDYWIHWNLNFFQNSSFHEKW